MFLPADHKCAIRQGFAASLLLTPIFFLDFWWNFRAQMRRECGSKAYPVARRAPLSPGEGDRPPAPARPRPGTYLQIGRKKLQTGHVAPWVGDRGIFLKFFETDIYF